MDLVSTITVGAGGAASISFTGIPQTGTDLLLVLSARVSNTAAMTIASFNSDITSTNYVHRRLEGNGSGSLTGTITDRGFYLPAGWSNATASTFGNASLYIPNYSSTGSKGASMNGVNENNASEAYQRFWAGRYLGTAAITSISIDAAYFGATLVQHSTASLYTIKKA